MDDIAKLGFSVDTSGLKKGEVAMKSYGETGEKTEAKVSKSASNMNSEFMSLKNAIGLASIAMAGIATNRFISSAAEYSDTWKGLSSQIRQVTESEAELVDVRAKLFDVTQATRAELDTTVRLFSEIKRSTDDLGISTAQQVNLTETLNNLFTAGGRPISEVSGAIRQLTQGFASGVLRGDEFNSVAEGAPRIMGALSASLKMTRGELREFAATGGITASAMVAALESYSDTAQKMADQTEETFAQNMQIAENNVVSFIGQSESLNGVIGSIGNGIEGLSGDIDSLVDAGAAMVSVIGVGLTASLTKSTAASVAQAVATISATRASALRIASEVTLLKIQKDNLAGSIAAVNSENIRNTMRMRLTATTSALTAAEVSLAAANSAVAKTASMAAVATNSLGVATKFLLGPWGLLLTAVGAAAAVFISSSDDSDTLTKSIEDQESAISNLTKKYKANSAAQLTNTLFKSNNTQLDYLDERLRLEKEIAKVGWNPFSEKSIELNEQLDSVNKTIDDLAAKSTAAGNILRKMASDGLDAIEWVGGGDGDGVVKITEEYQKWLDKVNGFQTPMQKLVSELDRVNKAGLDSAGATAYAKDLQSSIDALNEKAKDTTYQDWIDDITSDSTQGQLQGLQEEIAKTWSAMNAGDLDASIASERINDLKEQIKELNETTEEESPFKDMAGDIGGALSAIQGLTESGTTGYKNMAAAISIAEAAQAAMALSAATTMATVTGGISAVVSLVSMIGSLGGDLETTFEMNQSLQGLSEWGEKASSIADATETAADATKDLVGINTDMLSALVSMQSSISSASGISAKETSALDMGIDYTAGVSDLSSTGQLVGSVIGGITGAFFGLVDVGTLLGATIGNWIGGALSGSSKTTDSGISIVGGTIAELIDNTMVQAYEEVKSKKYKWSSAKTRTYYSDLEEASNQFGLVFDSLADTVYESGITLGMNAADLESAINDFEVATTKISLKNLSYDEQVDAIESVFSEIFNDLSSSVVPFVSDFQQAGEELGETLSRLATEVSIADYLVDNLGVTMGDKLSNPEAYTAAADNLSTLAGGVSELADKTSSFIDEFATDQQKLTIYSAALSEALGDVGLSIPATTEGFYGLRSAIDGSTTAGQEQIAALLNATDIASEYYGLLEDYTDDLTGLSESIADAIKDMYNISDAVNSVSLDSALAAARLGDFSEALNLDLSAYNLDESDFSTAIAFNSAQAQAANKLLEIAQLSDNVTGASSLEELTLSANQDQVELLTSINDTLSTAYTPASTSSSSNEDLVIELQAIREELQTIKAATKSTAESSATTDSTLSTIKRSSLNVRVVS